MLAAIDDESESASEDVQKPKGPQRIALGPVAGNVVKINVQKTLENESNNGEGQEEEEEEEDDGPIIPRGRLAAQLNGQSLKKTNFGSSEEENGTEDVYTRIKKQLLRKGARKAHETTSNSELDTVISKEERSLASSLGHRDSPALPSDHALSPSDSPLQRQRSSPGLFVTPESASGRCQSPEKAASNNGSDSDLPANPQTNSRFLELVARKRAEREAKQAEEGQNRAEKISKQRSFERQLARDASSGSDEDAIAGKRLTQQSRPTRKASKKALEEMSRETQRMSRNMQLTHQAKTKKKITKDSLFARFNFRTPATSCVETPQNTSSSTVASSAPVSEMEDAPGKESPPTSPAGPEHTFMPPEEFVVDKESTLMDAVLEPAALEIDAMPTVNESLTPSATKLDKGKGKAVEETNVLESLGSTLKRSKKIGFTLPPVKVRPQKPSLSNSRNVESDSDLEIMPVRKTKKSRKDVFDRMPAGKIQDGRSLQTLRALAHLNSPEKQRHSKKATMSLADMQTSLQRRARQQALEERTAKIEDLKSRGIIVQTAEERQQDQADVEDLLDKARREGEEIKQKERRAAKEKIANGELDDLPDTSDEDDDYQAEGEGDETEIEFSGSEEEQVDDADEADESESEAEDKSDKDEEVDENMLDGEKPENSDLIDNEASEDGDNEDEEDDIVDDCTEIEDEPRDSFHQRPRRSRTVIVDDDDDEDEDTIQDTLIGSVIREPAIEVPMFPLGLESSKLIGVPIGMTQAFAATMADTQEHADEVDNEQDSLAFLGPPPEPNFPLFDVHDSPQMIQDSQTEPQVPSTHPDQSTIPCKEIELDFSQSQIRYDALRDTQGSPTATQISEIPDPTQDVGFTLSSPAPERLSGPPSTVDTVLLSGTANSESPVKKKRGRLQRGAKTLDDASDGDEIYPSNANQTAGQSAPANAFEAMAKARERNPSANLVFDKKKSEAKTMVEEQAQESEDEYAGIGGASDEESGGDDDEFVKEMIDQGEVNVDENRLAAFYA
jgi:mediator of replication checkpoint protein 1